jgi:hypothetical protein
VVPKYTNQEFLPGLCHYLIPDLENSYLCFTDLLCFAGQRIGMSNAYSLLHPGCLLVTIVTIVATDAVIALFDKILTVFSWQGTVPGKDHQH